MFKKLQNTGRRPQSSRCVSAVRQSFNRLCADRGGNIAILTALLFPFVVALGGGVIDWSAMRNQSARLQALADGAALLAVREMTLANTTENGLGSVVITFVNAGSTGGSNPQPIAITTTVSAKQQSVTVELRQKPVAYFNTILFKSVGELGASATARVLGTTKICAIALDETAPNAMVLQSRARMTANDCAVFSNSTASNGLHTKNSSRLVTSLTCSSGGYQGSDSNYEPAPLTDCPPVDDPLADRPEPSFASNCDADKTNVKLKDASVTLSPGVYCGGLIISGSSFVRFDPGVYIIKDGPFNVMNTARIDGTNVGFFLSGDKSTFNFSKWTTVDLTAPETGEMAGLLFFESRSRKATKDHKITSNNARTLLGTIYLSRSDLVVDGTDVVADQSAYTAIIARKIKLFDGPHLVLNANYDQTNIPVPKGVKNGSNAIGLVN